MKTNCFVFLICTIALSGCGGVKFANSSINKSLPEAFTTRSLYPAGVAGYEFQDLVGNILKISPTQNPLRIGILRPDQYNSVVIPITDPNNYYKSRIQKGAEAKGNYLVFAAEFTADQMAELELVDIARAGIAFDNDAVFAQIITKARDWVKNNPNHDATAKRLWIKSVVLTRRIYTDFTNVGVKASGQVGEVVGVSTGVYNKSEETDKSVLIAFEAFDIDELVLSSDTTIDTVNMLTKSIDLILDRSVYTESITGKIQ